jgi:peptidoglycan/LPS O-acetylase OafA/YrhL
MRYPRDPVQYLTNPKATSANVLQGRSAPRTIASSGHIPSLDGLRGVSFLLVFLSHAWGEIFPGGFGVTVFFFLSGFLITTLMRTEYQRNGRINLAHFWIRRALRILPPFYLVLIGATVWTALAYPPGALSLSATMARALHFTNYWTIYHGEAGEPVGTTVYWSLAVEEHFYLIFPLLYIALQRLRMSPRRQALILWGLCGVTLLWRCVLVGLFDASDIRIGRASDTRLDSILFGCALAVSNNPVLDRFSLREKEWKYALLPGAVLVLLISMLIPNPVYRETVRYSIQGIALTYLFIGVIRFHQWTPFRILNWPPLAFIGVLSYSLYLMHHAVIFAVRRVCPSLGKAEHGILALAICFAVAWAMYVLVERPCAKLRRRLTD